MRWRPSIRRLALGAGLTLAWCALWGELTAANLLSGAGLSILVLWADRPIQGGGVRIGPLVRLGGLVAVDLVRSTLSVAREVLTPTDYTDEAIVAVTTRGETRAHLLLVTVAVTVTPGTAVVDTDPDTGLLYIHLLHADREAETVAHVRELAELACAALPADEPPSAASGEVGP